MREDSAGYIVAKRFATDQHAVRAFWVVMELLAGAEESDLSAFRLDVGGTATVVVIGDPPEPELHDDLSAALRAGESTVLPDAVLRVLCHRRAEQTQLAPWVERHHRPGLHLRVEE